MITLKTNKILVPTDFTFAAQKAIQHAAFLAQLNKGEVILLHVHPTKQIFDQLNPLPELRQQVQMKNSLRERLSKIAEDIHKKYGIPVAAQVVYGHRVNGIVRHAEKQNVDLIVMGTNGHFSSSNLFLGSNAKRVLSKTSIPVMTVRSTAKKLGYSRILLPVDLSDHSRQKVNYTLQLAKLFAAKVYVVGQLDKNDLIHHYKLEVIMWQIKKLAESKNISVSTQIISTANPAAATLSLAVKKKTDLIVAMTDDHQKNSLLFKSKYDNELVGESEIPVLSLPPELPEENLETLSVAGY